MYQAALPLFASGLGGLGLLGWRRKRKGTATPLPDRAYCRLPTRLFAQAFLLNGTWLRMRSGSSIALSNPACLPLPSGRREGSSATPAFNVLGYCHSV
jgi:hypothetical protein